MTIVVDLAGVFPGGVLPPVGTIAARPAQLKGCLQSFSETTLPGTVRTQGEDNQSIAVRRRATHPTKTADATVILIQDDVQAFKDWFEVACMGGVLPTMFVMPWGKEECWRFAAEPVYRWQIGKGQGRHYCEIAFKLERLPHFRP